MCNGFTGVGRVSTTFARCAVLALCRRRSFAEDGKGRPHTGHKSLATGSGSESRTMTSGVSGSRLGVDVMDR